MDSFSMALGADVLDSLAGTSIFSTLGLKSRYWKTEMHPESRKKTALICYSHWLL